MKYLFGSILSEGIRLGSQIIVNQSQEVILFKNGKGLDIFGPGRHTISSGNIPFLRKIINLPFEGKTPFPAEVWYVNKTAKRDLKWGTARPIQIIDRKFNYPISVRAAGSWGLRIIDSRSFVTQIVGTLTEADSEKVENYFIGEIRQKLSNALGNIFLNQNITIFEVTSKLDVLSNFVSKKIEKEFIRFGVEIINFNVEQISIPDEELQKFQQILGRKMEIEQISQAKVGQAYMTMRTFDTLEKAAENEAGNAGALLSGGLGVGLGLGVGVQAGQKMGEAINIDKQAEDEAEPINKLKKLKKMLDLELITQNEFDLKKRQLLDSI